MSESAREMYVEAYSRPEAVHTGFDWYRAFPQDEKDRKTTMRAREFGSDSCSLPARRTRNRKSGGLCPGSAWLRVAQSRRPTDPSGHYAPDEQPNEVVAILRDFIIS